MAFKYKPRRRYNVNAKDKRTKEAEDYVKRMGAAVGSDLGVVMAEDAMNKIY